MPLVMLLMKIHVFVFWFLDWFGLGENVFRKGCINLYAELLTITQVVSHTIYDVFMKNHDVVIDNINA